MFAVTSALAVANPPPEPEVYTQQIELGRKTYVGMCARCHGIKLASNGLGADLRTFPKESKERFYESVNKGVRAMPAWETILKPGDLDNIWAYVGSVNGWTTSNSAATK